jgi:putative phosphoesterase
VAIERIGILADTHGSLLPDVVEVLEGSRVDLILHAGDIGTEQVLERLRAVAPVVAVCGNGDEALQHRYPWDLKLHLDGRRVLLCHWWDNYGRIHPRYARIVDEWRPHALVYGHTHIAVNETRGETLHLNPGYAGHPEPSRQRSVAVLDLVELRAEIVGLG